MDKDQIFGKIIEALMQISNAKKEEIHINNKLNKFIPPIAGLSLALAVDKRFEKVNLTDLSNALFDTVNSVAQLVDYIADVYK